VVVFAGAVDLTVCLTAGGGRGEEAYHDKSGERGADCDSAGIGVLHDGFLSGQVFIAVLFEA
jgi:hypothetical protein